MFTKTTAKTSQQIRCIEKIDGDGGLDVGVLECGWSLVIVYV